MQLDVGNEPYLSTAQALCLLISHIKVYITKNVPKACPFQLDFPILNRELGFYL